ncbi:PilZ domain-containing protein [Desulfogranum mediterraneum]|uniref:PilZ domain-containing protein n=1 Tax=Desulfogranum mediterraneum TaxID=160661 RepID=UPI000406C3CF|nr:PilZ domain-containing protein [Desulfogranum mediterraneum]
MTSEKPQIRLDQANNILYFSLLGQLKKQNIESLYTDIRFSVADLRPGFHVVADYSRCDFWYISAIPVLNKIIEFLLSQEVGSTIRIVRKDNTLFRQFLQLHDTIQGYKPIYVSSREEAEKLLTDDAIIIDRKGKRYPTSNLEVRIETPRENGTGTIIDISTSGCKIAAVPFAVECYETIFLEFVLGSQGTAQASRRLKALVVRKSEDFIAVEFMNITAEDAQLIEQSYARPS